VGRPVRGQADEDAVGQGVEAGPVGSLASIGGEPVAVEDRVDRPDPPVAGDAAGGVPGPPRRDELAKVRPAALAARPVPGRQRRGLVEEEELRVAPGRHHGAPPSLEREEARHPGPVAPDHPPDDAAGLVVEPAAIAHQRAAGRRREQVAGGRDPVLERPWRPGAPGHRRVAAAEPPCQSGRR
jgi:hypothetical protein